MTIIKNNSILINNLNGMDVQRAPVANGVTARLLSNQMSQVSDDRDGQQLQKLEYPLLLARDSRIEGGGAPMLQRGPLLQPKPVSPVTTPSTAPRNIPSGNHNTIRTTPNQPSAQPAVRPQSGNLQPSGAAFVNLPFSASSQLIHPPVIKHFRSGQAITNTNAGLYTQGAFVFAVPKGQDPNKLINRTYIGTSGLDVTELARQVMENRHWGGDTGAPVVGDFSSADYTQLTNMQVALNNGEPGATRLLRPYKALQQKLETNLVQIMNNTVTKQINKSGVEQATLSQSHATAVPLGPPTPITTKPVLPSISIDQAAGPEIRQSPYRFNLDGQDYGVKLNNHNPHGNTGEYSVTYTGTNGQTQTRGLDATNLKDAMQEVPQRARNGQLPGLTPPQTTTPSVAASPDSMTSASTITEPPVTPASTQTIGQGNDQVTVREYIPPTGSNDAPTYSVHPVKGGQPDLNQGFTLPVNDMNSALNAAQTALENGQLNAMLGKVEPPVADGTMSTNRYTLNVSGQSVDINLRQEHANQKTFFMADYTAGGQSQSIFIDAPTLDQAKQILQQKAQRPGQLPGFSANTADSADILLQPIGDTPNKRRPGDLTGAKPLLPDTIPETPPTGDRKLINDLAIPGDGAKAPIGSPLTLNPDTSNDRPLQWQPFTPTEIPLQTGGSIATPGTNQGVALPEIPESIDFAQNNPEVSLKDAASKINGNPFEVQGLSNNAPSDDAEQVDPTVQTQIDDIKNDVNRKLDSHFVTVHLQGMGEYDEPFMSESVFDVMNAWQGLADKTIEMPNGTERKLSDGEQQEIVQDSLEHIAKYMLSITTDQTPDTEPGAGDFESVVAALDRLNGFLGSKSSFEENEVGDNTYDFLNGDMNARHIQRVVSNLLLFKVYEKFGSQDPNSAFQKLGSTMREIITSSPNAKSYQKVYTELLRAFDKTTDVVLSGNYEPSFGAQNDAIKTYYETHIQPGLLNILNSVDAAQQQGQEANPTLLSF